MGLLWLMASKRVAFPTRYACPDGELRYRLLGEQSILSSEQASSVTFDRLPGLPGGWPADRTIPGANLLLKQNSDEPAVRTPAKQSRPVKPLRCVCLLPLIC